MQEKENTSLLKPLPIFCAVICVAVIIAYAIFIYTNGQQQRKLIGFLETSFNSKVTIDEFEYSPISNNLKITKLYLFFPDSNDTALTIENIRASIKNIKSNSAEIENMKISGIKINTKTYDAKDIISLFQMPIKQIDNSKQNNNYTLVVRNIDIDTATFYAPDIDAPNKNVSFTLPEIQVSDIGTGNYTAVLATIFDAIATNIGRVILKHKIAYKLKGGAVHLNMLKNFALSNAKIQLNKIENELKTANQSLQQQIETIGKAIDNSINSIQNEIKEIPTK